MYLLRIVTMDGLTGLTPLAVDARTATSLSVASADAVSAGHLQASDPDALYAAREDLAKAREAAAAWAD